MPKSSPQCGIFYSDAAFAFRLSALAWTLAWVAFFFSFRSTSFRMRLAVFFLMRSTRLCATLTWTWSRLLIHSASSFSTLSSGTSDFGSTPSFFCILSFWRVTSIWRRRSSRVRPGMALTSALILASAASESASESESESELESEPASSSAVLDPGSGLTAVAVLRDGPTSIMNKGLLCFSFFSFLLFLSFSLASFAAFFFFFLSPASESLSNDMNSSAGCYRTIVVNKSAYRSGVVVELVGLTVVAGTSLSFTWTIVAGEPGGESSAAFSSTASSNSSSTISLIFFTFFSFFSRFSFLSFLLFDFLTLSSEDLFFTLTSGEASRARSLAILSELGEGKVRSYLPGMVCSTLTTRARKLKNLKELIEW